MTKLKDAIKQLDPEDNDSWTAEGLPRASKIQEITGTQYSREEIDEATGEDFNRDKAREMGANKGSDGASAASPAAGKVVTDSGLSQTEQDRAGIVDLDENPNAPKIRAQIEPEDSDRLVKLGDGVVVHTPNPINGRLSNPATVTRLNSDGTINAAIDKGDGTVQEMNSIKNYAPNPGDTSAFFRWPRA